MSTTITRDLKQEALDLLASRPDLGRDDVGSAIAGYGPTYLRQYLGGFKAGSPAFLTALGDTLGAIARGELLAPGAGAVTITEAQSDERPGRVLSRRKFEARAMYITGTVRAVMQTLDWCVEHSALGLVAGEYGIGKTECAEWWRAQRRVESVVIEISTFTDSSKLAFISELSEALGVEQRGNGRAAFHQVIAHLRENPTLIIIDQAETLSERVLQTVRQLWDRTRRQGTAIVLLASPLLLARLYGSRAANLAAATSRFGVIAPLSGLKADELADILKREKITDMDDAAFDLLYRGVRTSMRRVWAVIDLLRSAHAGKRVSEKTITQVMRHLWAWKN